MMAETYFKFDSIPLGIKYSQTREEVKPYVEVLTRCQDKVGMLLDMTVNSEDRICKQAMFDMFTIDTRSKLSEISAPVLILGTWFAYKDYGITAESTTEALTVQYSNLKSKEIYVHSDSGHFIMWDAPEWFMYHLFKFLKWVKNNQLQLYLIYSSFNERIWIWKGLVLSLIALNVKINKGIRLSNADCIDCSFHLRKFDLC